MSFHIDDEKLLEKYKAIWMKIEDLKKNVNLLTYKTKHFIYKYIYTTVLIKLCL